jgi:hypothetical protein
MVMSVNQILTDFTVSGFIIVTNFYGPICLPLLSLQLQLLCALSYTVL